MVSLERLDAHTDPRAADRCPGDRPAGAGALALRVGSGAPAAPEHRGRFPAHLAPTETPPASPRSAALQETLHVGVELVRRLDEGEVAGVGLRDEAGARGPVGHGAAPVGAGPP